MTSEPRDLQQSDPPPAVPTSGAPRTDPPSSPPTRRRRWRWLGTLAVVAACLLAVLVGAAFAVRAYFDDDRLRRMLEEQATRRLGTEVTIGSLELGVLTGAVLSRLRIAAPPTFDRDVLSARRIAVRWDLMSLINEELRIEEVGVGGLRLALQRHPDGKSNIDALMEAMRKASGEEHVPPPPPPEDGAAGPDPIRQPHLPIAVTVRRVFFSAEELVVDTPDLKLVQTGVGAEGSFHGYGDEMALTLWAGLGDRDPTGAPASLRMVHGPGRRIDATQRVAFLLESSGVANMQLSLKTDVEIQVREEVPDSDGPQTRRHGRPHKARELPAVSIRGDVQVTVDLLDQTAEISTCRWQVGDHTTLQLTATANDFLSAPRLSVGAIEAHADLGKLQPLVIAVAPQLETGGTVDLSTRPFTAAPAALRNPAELPLAVQMKARNINVSLAPLHLRGLHFDGSVALLEGKALIDAKIRLHRARRGADRLAGVFATLHTTTPLAPWLGGPLGGNVDTLFELEMKRAEATAGSVSGLALSVEATTPTKLIRLRRADEPAVIKTTLHLDRAAAAGQGTVEGINVQSLTRVWDLSGAEVATDSEIRLKGISLPANGRPSPIAIHDIVASANVARRHAHIALERADFAIGQTLRTQARFAIDDAFSTAPRIHNAEVTLLPLDIAAALRLLPAAMAPPLGLRGTATMHFTFDGTLPYAELAGYAKPPTATLQANDPLAWSRLISSYSDYLQGWANRFDAGLPFSAHAELNLSDMAANSNGNQLSGMDLAAVFDFDSYNPQARLDINFSELQGNASLRGLSSRLEATWEKGGTLALGGHASIAQATAPGVVVPLQGLDMNTTVRYRIGGDLLFEAFDFQVQSHGLAMGGSGLIGKPLRLAAQRSWLQPGLPNTDVALRTHLSFRRQDLLTLNAAGAAMSGEMHIDGTLEIKDGIMALLGNLRCESLNAAAGTLVVEDVTGALPFDVRLAFDRRADGITIETAAPIPLGSGHLTLLTSTEGVGNQTKTRPEYYDRLRPYSGRRGISIARVSNGPHEVQDIEVEGRLAHGTLTADWIVMHVLGGDVVGNMALQLRADQSVVGDFDFKASNIDASTFEALQLTPGPESELSADLRLGFILAARRRDLTVNMNVTKIGPTTFDRLLQLLDPEEEDANIQKQRRNMWWFEKGLLRLDEVNAWIRYENLNINTNATSFIGIPGTGIAYFPIDRETLRRFHLGGFLDQYMQPQVQRVFARPLGWDHAN